MELSPMPERRLYERAKKRVRAQRSFYVHVAAYCLVIPILIYVNLRFTPEFYWFFFSMAGWGIGLFFHAMEAFNWSPFFGKDWEERKIREIMDREENQTKKH